MQYRHLAGLSSLARAAWRGRVKYLILHVNSVCNAKCRMCFSWDGMMSRWDAKGMSLEELTKLARSMAPLPQLTVSGGEPLLRKDLPDILSAFYDQAETRFFTCPTNSLLPDRVEHLIDEFVRQCPKGFLNFCLPFHGDAEHFDDIMGVPGNYEKFRRTYSVIQAQRRRHPNVSCVLNFVMSRFNYEHHRAIIDTALRDFHETPLGIAYCRGLTHERDATEVPVEVYREAQAYLAARRPNHSRYNPYTLMFDAIGEQVAVVVADVAAGEVSDLACGAGRNFLVVYDNGAVYPCELLEVVGVPQATGDSEQAPASACLGNLHDFDGDMGALLESPDAQRLVNWIKDHDCACTWECAVYSRIVHNPKDVAKLGAKTARNIVKRRARGEESR